MTPDDLPPGWPPLCDACGHEHDTDNAFCNTCIHDGRADWWMAREDNR